jgi:hypothetical protein
MGTNNPSNKSDMSNRARNCKKLQGLLLGFSPDGKQRQHCSYLDGEVITDE